MDGTLTQSSQAAEMRGKILELEAAMLKLPQVDIPLRHHFAPGLYLREMEMPAGVCITGKIHKTEHYCILSRGKVTVQTEDGQETLEAPAVIHSMPGVKRALYAHNDVTWVNVHHNPENERDLAKIEAHFVADSYEEYLSFTEALKLGEVK